MNVLGVEKLKKKFLQSQGPLRPRMFEDDELIPSVLGAKGDEAATAAENRCRAKVVGGFII